MAGFVDDATLLLIGARLSRRACRLFRLTPRSPVLANDVACCGVLAAAARRALAVYTAWRLPAAAAPAPPAAPPPPAPRPPLPPPSAASPGEWAYLPRPQRSAAPDASPAGYYPSPPQHPNNGLGSPASSWGGGPIDSPAELAAYQSWAEQARSGGLLPLSGPAGYVAPLYRPSPVAAPPPSAAAPPSPAEAEAASMAAAVRLFGEDPTRIGVWTDRTREWLAARVVQPLSVLLATSHSCVAACCAAVPELLPLQPPPLAPPTRARFTHPLFASPFFSPQPQTGGAAAAAAAASSEPMLRVVAELLWAWRSSSGGVLPPPAAAALDAVVTHLGLMQLVAGACPSGLLGPVPPGYVASRVRALAQGTCLEAFKWDGTGEDEWTGAGRFGGGTIQSGAARGGGRGGTAAAATPGGAASTPGAATATPASGARGGGGGTAYAFSSPSPSGFALSSLFATPQRTPASSQRAASPGGAQSPLPPHGAAPSSSASSELPDDSSLLLYIVTAFFMAPGWQFPPECAGLNGSGSGGGGAASAFYGGRGGPLFVGSLPHPSGVPDTFSAVLVAPLAPSRDQVGGVSLSASRSAPPRFHVHALGREVVATAGHNGLLHALVVFMLAARERLGGAIGASRLDAPRVAASAIFSEPGDRL